MTKKLMHVYVDGYNLYCSCREYTDFGRKAKVSLPYPNAALWYDPRKIALESLAGCGGIPAERKPESLKQIAASFYTARPLRDDRRYDEKHYGMYMNALTGNNINVVKGVFDKQTAKIPSPPARTSRAKAGAGEKQTTKIVPYYKEKQSDVNLTKDLISGALKNEYDTAVVISADRDFYPAIRDVLQTDAAPAKVVALLLPPSPRHPDDAGVATIKNKIAGKKLNEEQRDNLHVIRLTMDVVARCRLDAPLPAHLA